MPEVLRIKGYVFFFYSNESREPVHVHVEKAEAQGEIWLEPKIKNAYMYGFTPRQKKEIRKITEENLETIKTKWYEYFEK